MLLVLSIAIPAWLLVVAALMALGRAAALGDRAAERVGPPRLRVVDGGGPSERPRRRLAL
jgi:uncharacterized protein (DUF3084 family)